MLPTRVFVFRDPATSCKGISLFYQLQYCNIACVQDYKPLCIVQGSMHYYTTVYNYKPILLCIQNVFVLFLSGVLAWRLM